MAVSWEGGMTATGHGMACGVALPALLLSLKKPIPSTTVVVWRSTGRENLFDINDSSPVV